MAGYVELAKLRRRKRNTKQLILRWERLVFSALCAERRQASLPSWNPSCHFLGTTGSTAPFIGLLGTVIGIMSAFQKIGLDSSAGLETVAPGIGGALVATAFGLFAAIPAVIAYNFLLSRIRVLDSEMENFAADFLNIIKRHFF